MCGLKVHMNERQCLSNLGKARTTVGTLMVRPPPWLFPIFNTGSHCLESSRRSYQLRNFLYYSISYVTLADSSPGIHLIDLLPSWWKLFFPNNRWAMSWYKLLHGFPTAVTGLKDSSVNRLEHINRYVLDK